MATLRSATILKQINSKENVKANRGEKLSVFVLRAKRSVKSSIF
jgi:hypothetical protein